MITAVTAFVPIPDHPRTAKEYCDLGARLLAVDIPILFAEGDLERCWLYEYLRSKYDSPQDFTCSVGDNPEKNSLAYHCVQAQKTEFLEIASIFNPFADVFVWIDYGIFHLPGMTSEIISDFFRRAESEQAIAIPGCWERDSFVYDDNRPCWRFCGGVMVVPRKYVRAFNISMKQEYLRWLDHTGNISWEVNALARMELVEPELPIWWYGPCDHDASMFTNYKATEHADARRSPVLAQRNEGVER